MIASGTALWHHLVDHEEVAAIGCLVNGRFHDIDPAEVGAEVVAQEPVMVRGNIDQPSAFVDLAQQFPDNIVVLLGPVPAHEV